MTGERANRLTDLVRVERALAKATEVFRGSAAARIEISLKDGGEPVTRHDREVNEILRRSLPSAGEGWLSEESGDSVDRLGCHRVWVVDPLDGTKEFTQGIPEWCVSVALVEDGEPTVGGVVNPVTRELITGALGIGVRLNGQVARPSTRSALEGSIVLASRSEMGRGEWRIFEGRGFCVIPMGSVAYKMARVAVGLAEATWTLVPKHEWDVAAGAALIRAAGGEAYEWPSSVRRFNRGDPRLSGFVAAAAGVLPDVHRLLTHVAPPTAPNSARQPPA
jgi:myo-inositol-1(or 4)-monophosphatase